MIRQSDANINLTDGLQTFDDGIQQPDSVSRARGDPTRQAREFVAQRLQIQQSDIGYRSGYVRDGIQHAYLGQTIVRLPMARCSLAQLLQHRTACWLSMLFRMSHSRVIK